MPDSASPRSFGFRLPRLIPLAAVLAALVTHVSGQAADPNAEEKKKQPQVRVICVSALKDNQEVVVASRDEKGTWEELGSVTLRSSFVTDWVPARSGELHLALREGGTLKSICLFNYPADSRRAMVVVLPDPKKGSYNSFIVDPEKSGLAKGSVLAVNFSTQPGLLLLGGTKVTVAPGQRVVAKPALEDNGMYRLMVAYQDAENKVVPCYDRYLPGNPDSRDMLFLFPDKTLGLKVFALPIFGDLE